MQTTTQIIAPLQGYAQPTRDTKTAHSAPPQDIGATSPDHPILDRTAKQQQFALGPVEAEKSPPTIALLRDVLTACHVHGTARELAYELLSYWKPGGNVYPSVRTLADGLGVKPRAVSKNLARLHRIGVWVRQEEHGKTNRYALRIPGVDKTKCPLRSTVPRNTPPCPQEHPEVTREVKRRTKSSARTSRRSDPVRPEGKRTHCPKCEHTWPSMFGTACYQCRYDPGSTPDAQPTDDDTPADGYRGSRIRNCPTCGAFEREHEDRCQHCDWTREVWEARVIDGEA